MKSRICGVILAEASIKAGRAEPSDRITLWGSASAATNSTSTSARRIGAIDRVSVRACHSHHRSSSATSAISRKASGRAKVSPLIGR